eukprot:scaffold20.g7747.t1
MQHTSSPPPPRQQAPTADAIREGLRSSRQQLSALHRQLLAMQREAVRQQRLVGVVLLEKECELRLARAEAEALRTAGRARTAVVSSLHNAVAAVQEDKAALAVALQQVQQEAGEQRRRHAAELGAALAALAAKAGTLQEAQAAAAGATGLAARLAGAVGLVEQQLQGARVQAASLEADNCQLSDELAKAAALRAAGGAGTGDPSLEAQVAQLQRAVCAFVTSHATLKQQLGELSGDATALAGCMRAELEQQREANTQLVARVETAEADAAAAAAELASTCDQNAELARRAAQLEQEVDMLAAERESSAGEREGLQQALAALEADKAALSQQAARLQAEAASLRRLVRALQAGHVHDSPSPRPTTSAAGAPWGEVEDDERSEADSSRDAASEAAVAPERSGASTREAFLEEQVESLSAALLRLQQQNRQLRTAGGAPEGQQQHGLAGELGGLRAENAALRRALAASEEEAAEARQEVSRLQLEADRLLGEVVQVMQTLSAAGLAPPAAPGSIPASGVALLPPAVQKPAALLPSPPRLQKQQQQQQLHEAVPLTPQSGSHTGAAVGRSSSTGSETLVAELQHALAAMDLPVGTPHSGGAAAPAHASAAGAEPPASPPAGGLASVEADLRALQGLNARLQEEIDAISVASSVQLTPRVERGRSAPATVAGAAGASPGKAGAGSMGLLPRTPDASY